ncbi:MAG: DUF933 domain-containing protein [Deltaproteobacteria bacterium]|nr:DUF933 domain-containing protein [Deltaproteobacteria bacterium]
MEIGIIGLPQSGKSTVFEIMTRVVSRGIHDPLVRGQATIIDGRLTHIAKSFSSRSIVYAKIPCVDVNATGEKSWEMLRQHLSAANGIIHVVDAFTDNSIKEITAKCKKIKDEMIFSDLVIASARLEKLAKMSKVAMKRIDAVQAKVLPEVVNHLEEGKPLTELSIDEEEKYALKSFSFWSIKPQLVIINIAESDIGNEAMENIIAGAPTITCCAKTELELMSLPEEERIEFMGDLGIAQTAFGRLVEQAFSLLDQMCFFTAGEKESRAWITATRSKAPQAASVIHKDFERGFIKAEVVSYQDFLENGSSMARVKEVGKFRLEGKDYTVQEADIITFRFNV